MSYPSLTDQGSVSESSKTTTNVIGPISMNDFRLMTMIKGSLKQFEKMGNPEKYLPVIEKEKAILKETIEKYTKPTATEIAVAA